MALSSKGDGGSRGRPYGMMLLLAFGAAVLGVMVLHMLRERRSFSILIQHKDQDIMNLHLLLKKERESSIEYRKNIDDLKAQAYSLQTQKMELSNKVATLQSITTSLKDEQRVLESIIEDNQSIIRTLQQKRTELSEGKSQKKAGIKEMKRHASKPTKI